MKPQEIIDNIDQVDMQLRAMRGYMNMAKEHVEASAANLDDSELWQVATIMTEMIDGIRARLDDTSCMVQVYAHASATA